MSYSLKCNHNWIDDSEFFHGYWTFKCTKCTATYIKH